MANNVTTKETTIETHSVCLEKLAERSLQVKVIEKNLASLLGSVNSRGNAVRGWRIDADTRHHGQAWIARPYDGQGNAEWKYELCLSVTFEPLDKSKHAEPHEFGAIARTIATRCVQPSFGRWSVATVDGKPWEPPEDNGETGSTDNPLLGYATVEIPGDWEDHFAHLYGLDSQILRVRRALEAGMISGWAHRSHCALIGPPGCGKSDLCASIKEALGEAAVMEFDATATTAAGAIKDLSEREILPRVVVIEEIEKAPEAAMTFLLGVLDLRAQIRKTTARSAIIRDTKLFAIATVNDEDLFRKLQAGALASRFSSTIHFSRPGREQLYLILEREINKVNGDIDWIEPTLDYCESMGITDPRVVTSICLCGREMLLDGSYQKLLRDTAKPVNN